MTLRNVCRAMSRLPFALLFAGALLISSGSAWAAPTIFMPADGVKHSLHRDHGEYHAQLSYADCESDVIDFTLQLTDSEPYELQVWAGRNCDRGVNRLVGDQCWELAAGPASPGSQKVSIPVIEMLSGRTLASPGAKQSELGVRDACRDGSDATAPQLLDVYFMLLDADGNNAAATSIFSAYYKLSGPPPPDHVALGIGNRKLLVAFDYDNLVDTTLDGYRIFCEPISNPSATAAPGAPGDDVPDVECGVSHSLLPGGHVDQDIANSECGLATKTATVAEALGLSNDVSYNVAMAAVDTYGNVGALSEVVCAAPLAHVPGEDPPSDRSSRACSFSPRRATFPALITLALGLGLLRRRRSRVSTA